MKAIVAVDKNWGIGKNGGLLFRIPKDMAFFRETTLNKTVVVGATTYKSFPHGALKDRINFVLDDTGRQYPGATSVSSIAELGNCVDFNSDDVYVIGGASVYAALIDRCSEALVTKVHADGEADTFFPNLDELPGWEQVFQSQPIDDNGYTLRFCRYVNRSV